MKRAAKHFAKTLAIITVLHFGSLIYLTAENYVREYIWQGTNYAFASIGYERVRLPDPELDDLALVEREALRHQLNPSLGRALMKAESAKNKGAMSPKGALGLMQVMPFNAKRCGLAGPAELVDPEKNIKCGMQILAEEMKTYKGDVVKAIQSYNGGPKCIGRCAESIEHSRKVLAELATDLG